MKKKHTKRQILFSAAALGAALALRSAARTRYTFKGKSVLITGGSRGLGLVIARILASEGARLTLVSRNAEALKMAEAELMPLGGEVLTVVADVREPDQARAVVERAILHFGSLDVLINNAGIIQVGPFDVMTAADFQNALATHFWGPFHLITAALPHMRERKNGRIVNISSIGGRVAVPHLMPYTVSKFALAGFSDALRAELAPENILVTSVYPGLMRTGSHVNATFKGENEKEFAWFSILSGLPFLSINARRAARQIVEACRSGSPELIITTQARVAVAMNALFPGLMAGSMKLMNALLPKAGDASRNESFSGWDSMSLWSPSLLTTLADRAIEENNEYQAA